MLKKYDVKILNDKGAEYMNDLIQQLEPGHSVNVGDEVIVTEDSNHPFCIPVVILMGADDVDIDDFTYALNKSHFR